MIWAVWASAAEQWGGAGLRAGASGVIALHLINDLIDPEAFQPMKQLVERSEFVGIDATSLLHRASVLQAECVDNLADLASFWGQLDVYRASINQRALLFQ